MVSVAIFTIVMTIALGALLSMSESDRKAQSYKSVINNLNFALESMSRNIRTASDWRCGLGQYVPCPSGANIFSFRIPSDVRYNWERSNATLCGQPVGTVGCITRSTDSGANYYPITSPEVVITNLTFYLIGNSLTDNIQPKVTILMSGEVVVTATQKSAFNLQTSITQRLYDQ